MLSMPVHSCKWWALKFTCLNAHIKPGTGHCSTCVFCSWIFNWKSWRQFWIRGQGWEEHKLLLMAKKPHYLLFQERQILEAEDLLELALLRIHRRIREAVSSFSHLVKKTISCHLTLHLEHLQTNAKSAGYLPFCCQCFASCSLCLLFQKSSFSEETPWKSPHFLTPRRALGKWPCDPGAKASAANLPHLPQSPAAAKLKIAATGKPWLKMRTFVPLLQADNGVTVDMFGLWKEH